MIITRTPVRISFFGGGTDYPDYFLDHGGVVLGASIDKYSYITLKSYHRLSKFTYRIAYSQIEELDKLNRISHPSIKACLKYFGINDPLEIHYIGDWPANTGLGSSSSFTVGFILALSVLKDWRWSSKILAEKAIHVEQKVIHERVGCQDQILSAYGGFNFIHFNKLGFKVVPLSINSHMLKAFRSHILLFYTGIRRVAHKILKEQISNTRQGRKDSELFKMKEYCQTAKDLLLQGQFEAFGKLLHQNWKLKKSLSRQISNSSIDQAYQSAIRCGAWGGKLLGAGGGGFLLVFASPSYHKQIIRSLKKMTLVNFDFESLGSRVIYHHPN